MMHKILFSALCLLASLFVSMGLTGCASMGASGIEDLLSASGFSPMQPQNAEQKIAYDNLTPYKMQTGIIKGKRLYGYKDEKKGVVYVGGETQYQTYQRLRLERNIADQNMAAAQMNSMTIQRYAYFRPMLVR